jgi:hypothetical protein
MSPASKADVPPFDFGEEAMDGGGEVVRAGHSIPASTRIGSFRGAFADSRKRGPSATLDPVAEPLSP